MSRLPEDLKGLFVEFLVDLTSEAVNKGTKVALLYNKALTNIRQFDRIINEPKTLREVPYVGAKTKETLVRKLREHCLEKGFEIPESFAAHEVDGESSKRNREGEQEEQGKKKTKRAKSTRQYIPKRRSGGFAILLALYLNDRRSTGLCREEIATSASAFCDKSFRTNPASHEFYSAWDSIKALLNHDLVGISGRTPRRYFLTDTGIELARKLKEAESINTSPIHSSAADISFDNGLRVSSEISMLSEDHAGLVSDNLADQRDYSNRQVLSDLTSGALNRTSVLQSSPIKVSPATFRPDLSHNDQASMLSPLMPDTRLVAKQQEIHHDRKNKIYGDHEYDIWNANEYEVILIIDNREIRNQQERDFFQTRLENLGVKCEVRSLSVGDALWVARRAQTGKEVVLNYICERKKLSDLVQSIKDGRFHEQKNRLKKSFMKHNYYLVEEGGTSTYEKYTDMGEAIRTSMSMTMTLNGFYLKKTKVIDDTVNFFAALTNVIKEELSLSHKKFVVIKPRSIDTQEQYGQLLQLFRARFEKKPNSKYECVYLFSTFQDVLAKTGMMTVKEMFILTLMTIRGVSLERAVAIQNRFSTPKHLIDFFHLEHKNTSTNEKKKLMMREFQEQVGNKKIGPALSTKIYDIWGA